MLERLAFALIKNSIMKPKKNIMDLVSYQVKDEPYRLKLDANESMSYLKNELLDVSDIERYPDFDSKQIRMVLSRDLNIDFSNITMGNGSSELLDLLFKSFLSKDDVILSFDPSFSMYEIYANIYEASFIKVPARNNFSCDIKDMIDKLVLNPKIIILCTPNNPTGYQLTRQEIITLLSYTQSLVIVDEAYIEFSINNETMINDIATYPNLVVLRTFSKAYGLAGARLGYMIASDPITSLIKKVRSPYHVNALSQRIGIMALEKKNSVIKGINDIRDARKLLASELDKLGFIVYPSQANFLFIKSPITSLSEKLKEKGVLIRRVMYLGKTYYRITVTHIDEMNLLLKYIKEVMYETK